MWETGGMEDTETGLHHAWGWTRAAWLPAAGTRATQPSKRTKYRLEGCKNTATQWREAEHIHLSPAAASPVSHAPRLSKAKQIHSNHGKKSQISTSNATRETNTCHDTTNLFLHKLCHFKPARWMCLQQQGYTAKYTPKSIPSSELSATHTFSFFPTKTTSIVFLLLLRSSHACSLTGIKFLVLISSGDLFVDMIGQVPHDAHTVLHRLLRRHLGYTKYCTLLFANRYIIQGRVQRNLKKSPPVPGKECSFQGRFS